MEKIFMREGMRVFLACLCVLVAMTAKAGNDVNTHDTEYHGEAHGNHYHSGVKAIEHQGERYIIHVEALGLTGDESLLDVLMLCPEAVTLDGKTQIAGGQTANPFDEYVVRTDNMSIDIDVETFLNETKACEVERIVCCFQPGIMKGPNGLRKVIDVYFRKEGNGTNGRISAAADTYGNLRTYNTIKQEKDNMLVWASTIGKLCHDRIGSDRYHSAKVGINWDISAKDNLVLQAAYCFDRERERSGGAYGYSRYQSFQWDYIRSISDAGAYFLFQGGVDYANGKAGTDAAGSAARDRETDPFFCTEFGTPFIHKDIYLTAGIETGATNYENVILDYTNWAHYGDLYAQIDWKLGPLSLCIGDRVRVQNFWQNEGNVAATGLAAAPATGIQSPELTYAHSKFNHNYTFSLAAQISRHSTLQGTFAHRFWSPGFDNFCGEDNQGNFRYIHDVTMPHAYTAELKYTYQCRDLIIMGMINNVHHNHVGQDPFHDSNGNENTLILGLSAYWHKGPLRLTAGAAYYHDRINYGIAQPVDHNNYVRLRLQPQLSLPGEWRIVPTIIYNGRPAYDDGTPLAIYNMQTPAACLATLAVCKPIGKHWDFDLTLCNLSSQRYGRRNLSLGATYYWGGK